MPALMAGEQRLWLILFISARGSTLQRAGWQTLVVPALMAGEQRLLPIVYAVTATNIVMHIFTFTVECEHATEHPGCRQKWNKPQ